eukprot:SAG31_NODE_904_length_11120_cov_76.575084_9_plen_112_part_00
MRSGSALLNLDRLNSTGLSGSHKQLRQSVLAASAIPKLAAVGDLTLVARPVRKSLVSVYISNHRIFVSNGIHRRVRNEMLARMVSAHKILTDEYVDIRPRLYVVHFAQFER